MAFDIKALRQRQHDLKAEGQGLLDKVKAEARNPSDEEESRLQAIETELEEVSADIQKAEKQLDRERNMAPLEVPDGARITGGGRVTDNMATAGFEGMAEFAVAVKEACHPGGVGRPDDRLNAMYAAPTNFHREGGSSDGYMVPPAFRDQIWELVMDDEEPDLITMVDMEPTDRNAVELLADETTPWGSSGVQANWRAEGSQMTPSRLDTDGRQVKLHELYAFVLATEELLEDAPRLNDRLTRKSAMAIRWKSAEAIMYGNGVGKPLGWFESGALVSVAKEASQAADTVQAANVAKMYSRNLRPGRAFWFVNSDVLPQLMTMTISNQPIWTPPNAGFANAPGGMLLGRPVLFTEQAKTVGDKGDIQFVDPMGYYATQKRGGIKFNTSIHLYFDYNIQAFRWTFRLGGQPYLSAPRDPANGSSTKSHFVTLDERA